MQWKNFENPLKIDKVIDMSLVYQFFGMEFGNEHDTTRQTDFGTRE